MNDVNANSDRMIEIPDWISAYLIKTCNGKYYQTCEGKRIDYYKDPINSERRIRC